MPTFCNISVVSQRYKIVASKLNVCCKCFFSFYKQNPDFHKSGFCHVQKNLYL